MNKIKSVDRDPKNNVLCVLLFSHQNVPKFTNQDKYFEPESGSVIHRKDTAVNKLMTVPVIKKLSILSVLSSCLGFSIMKDFVT